MAKVLQLQDDTTFENVLLYRKICGCCYTLMLNNDSNGSINMYLNPRLKACLCNKYTFQSTLC